MPPSSPLSTTLFGKKCFLSLRITLGPKSRQPKLTIVPLESPKYFPILPVNVLASMYPSIQLGSYRPSSTILAHLHWPFTTSSVPRSKFSLSPFAVNRVSPDWSLFQSLFSPNGAQVARESWAASQLRAGCIDSKEDRKEELLKCLWVRISKKRMKKSQR